MGHKKTRAASQYLKAKHVEVPPLQLVESHLEYLRITLAAVRETNRTSEDWIKNNDALPKVERSPAGRRKHDGLLRWGLTRRANIMNRIREYVAAVERLKPTPKTKPSE